MGLSQNKGEMSLRTAISILEHMAQGLEKNGQTAEEIIQAFSVDATYAAQLRDAYRKSLRVSIEALKDISG